MKVLLCTVPLHTGGPRHEGHLPIMPKIAIVSLLRWMEPHGYTRESYDFYDADMLDPSDEELAVFFAASQPTVVGLSAVVSTSYLQVRRLAGILRRVCPDAWIVLGGNLAASANVVLRRTAVDVCIQGDGEIPWVEFLDYVRRNGRAWNYEELRAIRGVTFLDADGELHFAGYPESIPAAANPFPDYDLLALGLKGRPELIQNYFRDGVGSPWFNRDPRAFAPGRRKRFAALWTSKGCVARCTFCQRSTKGYHLFDLQALDRHLEELRERFEVGFVQVCDENFEAHRQHARGVADLMRKHDMLWMAGGVRCTNVSREDIQYFRETGCTGLKFGVESGSQVILDVMEKKFDVNRVSQVLQYCAENEVFSPTAVMLGMPGETDETVRQTGRFLGTIGRMRGIPPSKSFLEVFYAVPFPGTPLYAYAQRCGVIGTSVDAEEDYLKAVSDCGSIKTVANYLNLSGASLWRATFWDALVRLEANRVYYQNPAVKERCPVAPQPAECATSEQSEGAMRYLLRVIRTYVVARRGRGLAELVVQKVGGKMAEAWTAWLDSPLVLRLPSRPVDCLLRNARFAGFVLERLAIRASAFIERWRGHEPIVRNVYRRWDLSKTRSTTWIETAGTRKARSLRQAVTEDAVEPSAPTLTERNRQVLSMGR